MPKQGGGREAFRSNEARMPGEGDEDYDGVDVFGNNKEGGRTKPKARWNRFKWCLFLANILVSTLLSPLCSSSGVFAISDARGDAVIPSRCSRAQRERGGMRLASLWTPPCIETAA